MKVGLMERGQLEQNSSGAKEPTFKPASPTSLNFKNYHYDGF